MDNAISLCIHCKKIVTDDDEAVDCDSCLLWNHIKCGDTGKTQN